MSATIYSHSIYHVVKLFCVLVLYHLSIDIVVLFNAGTFSFCNGQVSL